MATHTAAAKTFTVSAINGAVMTVDAFNASLSALTASLEAEDVGRWVVVTSGAGFLQRRRIVGVNSTAGTLTLAHAWDAPAFTGITEVVPNPASAVFVMSYSMVDLSSSDAQITWNTTQRRMEIATTGTTPVRFGSANVYAHITDASISFNSANIQIDRGGGLILGDYVYSEGQDAAPKSSVHGTDLVVGFDGDQFRSATNSFGMLAWYAGSITCHNNVFWRLYENTENASNRVFIRASITGRLGMRTARNAVLLLQANAVNTNIGIANPRGGRVGLDVVASQQALYINLSEGSSGRATITRAQDITNWIIRLVTLGSNPSTVYEVIGKKSEMDAAPVFLHVEGNAPNHTVRYGNIVRPRFVNTDTTAFTNQMKTYLVDANGNVVNNQTTSDGRFEDTFVRHTDITSTDGDHDLSDGVQHAPYTLYAYSYGSNRIVQTITAEDTFDSTLTVFTSTNISQRTQATVDAYTTFANLDQVFDRTEALKAESAIVGGISVDHQLLTVSGNSIVIPTGWELALAPTGQGDAMAIGSRTEGSTTINQLLIKTAALAAGTKFNQISGSVNANLDSLINSNVRYLKSNGMVASRISITAATGVSDLVWGIWAVGAQRSTIVTGEATDAIDVVPNTAYNLVADGINAVRSPVATFNSGTFGTTINASLLRIMATDGTNIITTPLTSAEQVIANIPSLDAQHGRVTLTLPDGFTADTTRYTARPTLPDDLYVVQSGDFNAIAWRVEAIQSSQGLLVDPHTIRVEEFKLTIDATSTLTFIQSATNRTRNSNRPIQIVFDFTIVKEGDSAHTQAHFNHTNGAISASGEPPVIATVDGGFGETQEELLTDTFNAARNAARNTQTA